MVKLDIAMSCLFQFYTHRKHRYYLLLTSLIMLTGEYKRQDFENDLKTHMRMKDLLVYKNLIEILLFFFLNYHCLSQVRHGVNA